MRKQSIKKIFENLTEITRNMKLNDMGEKELLTKLRQETYEGLENAATEMIRHKLINDKRS